MSKHTPGPWFIWQELAMQRDDMGSDEIADELLYEDTHFIYAGNPVECTRSSLRGHSASICEIDSSIDFDDDASRETAVANAHLIAAAPELLEALKNTLHVLELYCEDFEKEIRNQARSAIFKATGETA